MSNFRNELHKQIDFYQSLPSFLDVIFGKDKALVLDSSKIVIFGFGILGRQAALAFKHQGIDVDRFIDNDPNKWNKTFAGIECLPPESLTTAPENYSVLLSTAASLEQPIAQLKSLGIREDRIIWSGKHSPNLGNSLRYYLANCLYSTLISTNNPLDIIERDIGEISETYTRLADEKSRKILVSKLALTCVGESFGALENYLNEYSDTVIENARQLQSNSHGPSFPQPEFEFYFKQDFLTFVDGEIYVDVGAADGDTIVPFLETMAKKGKIVGKIYAFEPEGMSFRDLKNNLEKHEFIEFHQAGIAQESGNIQLPLVTERELKTYEVFQNNGDVTIPCVSLDEFFHGKDKPTFIKLDPGGDIIPGILRGAEKTICESRPKIIAGSYHSVESIYRVPGILLNSPQSYRVYLRHLAFHANETHAFAV